VTQGEEFGTVTLTAGFQEMFEGSSMGPRRVVLSDTDTLSLQYFSQSGDTQVDDSAGDNEPGHRFEIDDVIVPSELVLSFQRLGVLEDYRTVINLPSILRTSFSPQAPVAPGDAVEIGYELVGSDITSFGFVAPSVLDIDYLCDLEQPRGAILDASEGVQLPCDVAVIPRFVREGNVLDNFAPLSATARFDQNLNVACSAFSSDAYPRPIFITLIP